MSCIMHRAHTHTHMYMCVLSHPRTSANVGVSSHSCDDRTHVHVQKHTNVIIIVQKHKFGQVSMHVYKNMSMCVSSLSNPGTYSNNFFVCVCERESVLERECEKMCWCVRVCASVHLCVCVRVCVWEGERQRKKAHVHVCFVTLVYVFH